MTGHTSRPLPLPTDILVLIFEQLQGDSQSLSRLSRTCRAWHALCLPILLRTVDLSCHNLGRREEHEEPNLVTFAHIEADYADKYRPRDALISRQRAFLRLITEKPALASHVRSFTWTLIWRDFDKHSITGIDRQTWNVFGRLSRVTRLDLASLHEIWDEPYIRQNPDRLFPSVADLRLVGWMHRGLVKTIINSLDVSKLRSLKLDYLQDEGVLPGGESISSDLTQDFARSFQNRGTYQTLENDVVQKQEAGEAVIFPGPMWLPLQILRGRALTCLHEFRIRLAPFDEYVDLRNYHRTFSELSQFLRRCVFSSLKASLLQSSILIRHMRTVQARA